MERMAWLLLGLLIPTSACPASDGVEPTKEGGSVLSNKLFDLDNGGVTWADLAKALAAAEFNEVLGINLGGQPVGSVALDAIAESANTRALRYLGARKIGAGDEGVAALSRARTLRLETLHLTGNEISPAGVKALLGGTVLESVNELSLSQNPIGDEGAALLAASSKASALRTLDLTMTNITDVGARAVLSSPHLKGLETLVLTFNSLTDGAWSALLDPATLPNLSRLEVSESAMSEAIQRELAAKRGSLKVSRGP